MSSSAQVLANQHNATRSTGPKSPEGKATSSQNATRHGLTGGFSVLPHESQEAFDQLAASLRAEFRPEGEDETFLLDQMIQARWRLARIERLEAEAYEEILTSPNEPNGSPDSAILSAMSRTSNILDKLLRYAADARRAYFKARTELLAARARAKKAEANALDAYLKKVIFAPVPGAEECKAYDAAAHPFTKDPKVAKSAAAPSCTPGPLDNPAPRLVKGAELHASEPQNG